MERQNDEMRPWEFVCDMRIIQLVNVYFLLLFAFTFTFPTFLDRCLLGTLALPVAFAPPPTILNIFPPHSADSGYATSPILRSHPFFIFHISPNLTFHTVSFCCQLAIVLMLEYKTSSFTATSTSKPSSFWPFLIPSA
jgi:hypothetical protein